MTADPQGLSAANRALVKRHVSVVTGKSVNNTAYLIAEDDLKRLLDAARSEGLQPSAPPPEQGKDGWQDIKSVSPTADIFSPEGQLAERLKDPEWLAKWNADEQGLVSFQIMLHTLRKEEGASITLLCDNPDFNGLPNNAVECCGGWTGWTDRRFTGDTLTEAVRAAYRAMISAAPPLVEGEG